MILVPKYKEVLENFQRDLFEPIGGPSEWLGGLRRRDRYCLICVGVGAPIVVAVIILSGFGVIDWPKSITSALFALFS